MFELHGESGVDAALIGVTVCVDSQWCTYKGDGLIEWPNGSVDDLGNTSRITSFHKPDSEPDPMIIKSTTEKTSKYPNKTQTYGN